MAESAAVAASVKHTGSDKRASQYYLHKRPPKRLSSRLNDIYINKHSQFGQQLARCHRLLDQGLEELTIHGLGAAIHRAINLALQLQETSSHNLQITATTSTVELTDDLEPLTDDMDYRTQTRPNSAIHIHLTKIPLSPTLPSPTPPAVPSGTNHAHSDIDTVRSGEPLATRT